MPWLRFAFAVPQNTADTVLEELEELNATAISMFNAGQDVLWEPAVGCTPLWSDVQVEALFELETSVVEVREVLGKNQIVDVDVTFLEDQEWETTWLEKVEPKQFGRLWVVPREWSLSKEKLVVRLNPGLAFGTGEHATTQLCLEWLEQFDLREKSVLDFGCGSGILGIAAKVLGASRVMSVDYDPQAISATVENAQENNVELEVSDELAPGATYDVIVANILLRPLLDNSNVLLNALKPNGWIGLTGLLEEQQNAIRAAYSTADFTSTMRRDGWILMAGRQLSNDN